MNFQKHAIAIAVTGAFAVPTTGVAAIDLTNDDGPLTFAEEIAVSGGVTLDTENGTSGDFTVIQEIGSGIADGAKRFVRVDLDGGEFAGTKLAISLSDAGGGTGTLSDNTLLSGGAGEDFAVFEITEDDAAGGDSFDDDDPISVIVDDGSDGNGYSVDSKDGVSLRYRLYETQTAAENPDSSTALHDGGTNEIIEFDNALVSFIGTAGDDIAPGGVDAVDSIDVVQESKFFDDQEGDDVSNFGYAGLALEGSSELDAGSDDYLNVDGSEITGIDTIVDTGDLTAVASGNFSSAEELSNDGGSTFADDLVNSDGDAEFDVTNTNSGSPGGNFVDYVFQYKTNGDDVIPETTFDLTVGLGAQSGFELPAEIGPVNMDTFAKNGSSATANLVLTPTDEGGAFRNFLRITNPSTIDGAAFVTLINDDGDSVNVGLDEISVDGSTLPAELAAGESTRLIPSDALFDAAQAKDSSFGLASGDRNKLRVIVDGEFGSNADDTGVRVDNISVSRDNQSFSTFQ